MKKIFISISILFLLLLSGCVSEPQNIAPVDKQTPEIPLNQEKQRKKQEEQEKQWEEERKQQEKMNQDVQNSMTILIPAIM